MNEVGCISGSVVVKTTTTDLTPFVIGHGGIYYKGVLHLHLDPSVVTPHDTIEITTALNFAYQFGYAAKTS